MATKVADVRTRDEGSIILITPISPEAKAWVSENVQLEGWQWFGNSFSCEPRYVDDLIAGMQDAGLEVF